MQRVFRFTLAGALAIAGLTACGDKVTPVTITQGPGGTTVDSVVHSVTVTPPAVTMNVGDKVTLAASVDAGAGVTDRTVTWTSSNTAIATVDANGVVTAVAPGSASIIAASKANGSVKGAAAITVNNQNAVNATVTIASINKTTCGANGCSSAPANLGAANGQLDVTLNVDPGTQKLAGVDLIMNCNAAANFPASSDTVVASQNLGSSDVAPVAEAASAPVTLSFNTAAFNTTTGATSFKNGACQLKARARTSAGTQVASSTQSITLANQDVVVGTVAATANSNDATGLSWHGGNVTITAVPVFYTAGRTAASASIAYEGKTQSNLTGATLSATFTDGNGSNPGGATDIDAITDANSQNTIVVSVIDNSGNQFSNAVNGNCLIAAGPNAGAGTLCSTQSVQASAPAALFSATNPFRLDTQKPVAGSFAVRNNIAQQTSNNGYVNGSFRFAADSAAGYCGPNSTGYTPANSGTTTPVCTGNYTANTDNNGVDRVTVTFQSSPNTSTKTWTNVTTASSLNETNTATANVLRMITQDALGNADTSATQTFGVDKTAPTAVTSASGGPPASAQQTCQQPTTGSNPQQFCFQGIGNSNATPYATTAISDNLSGPSFDANGPRLLVAQTRIWSGLTAGNTATGDFSGIENFVYTNDAAAVAPGQTLRSPGQAPGDVSPCMIGRFNQTQAAAGQNAIQAFDRSGNAIGWCTPVYYTSTAGVPPAADVGFGSGSTTGGYYTTEIIAVDQAGNRAAPFTATVVEDTTRPTVSGVDLPGSISGNSTVSIPGTASDNVDIVASYATVGYTGAGMNLRYPNTAGPGVAFDNVLTRSGTVSPTITNFIRTLAPATAAAPADSRTGGNLAQTVNVTAVDEVNLPGGLAAPASLAPVSLGTQSSNSWSSQFTAGFAVTANNNPIWNCPAPASGQTTGCGAAGTSTPGATSTTFSATATGNSGTFNNPFSVVTFWYQNAAGDWVQFGSSTAATVSDVGGATGRTWTYTFTWDPPVSGTDGTNFTPAAGTSINVPIRAIGINSSGDAVTTNTYTLTINNT